MEGGWKGVGNGRLDRNLLGSFPQNVKLSPPLPACVGGVTPHLSLACLPWRIHATVWCCIDTRQTRVLGYEAVLFVNPGNLCVRPPHVLRRDVRPPQAQRTQPQEFPILVAVSVCGYGCGARLRFTSDSWIADCLETCNYM